MDPELFDLVGFAFLVVGIFSLLMFLGISVVRRR